MPWQSAFSALKDMTMAKGQTRSNREIRKPKKSAGVKAAAQVGSAVTATFAKPAKGQGKATKR